MNSLLTKPGVCSEADAPPRSHLGVSLAVCSALSTELPVKQEVVQRHPLEAPEEIHFDRHARKDFFKSLAWHVPSAVRKAVSLIVVPVRPPFAVLPCRKTSW